MALLTSILYCGTLDTFIRIKQWYQLKDDIRGLPTIYIYFTSNQIVLQFVVIASTKVNEDIFSLQEHNYSSLLSEVMIMTALS